MGRMVVSQWRMRRLIITPFLLVIFLAIITLYKMHLDPGESTAFTLDLNSSYTIDLPKLLPGNVNMPDVMYHSIVLLRGFFNKEHIKLGKALSECQHPTICKSLKILTKAFGPKKHLNLDDYAFQLNILRGRQLAQKPRQTFCHGCMKHNFNTLIAPRDICKDTNTTIDLFLILTTIPTNTGARNALRETWLQYSKNNTGSIRYLFLIGGGWPIEDLQRVKDENEIHGDILAEDYKDSYYNLSYKIHGGFRWAVKNCSCAKFVSRCADDIYLNVPRTLKYLKDNGKQMEDTVIGTCTSSEVVPRKWTRHYQSHKDYPQKSFGPYCVGKTLIMPFAASRKLVDVAPNVPYFNLEDHWLGFAGEKAKLKVKNVTGFNIEYYPKPNIKMYFQWRKEKGVCNFDKYWYSLHRVTEKDIRNIYSQCIVTK